MGKMKPLLYNVDKLKEYFRHIECAAIYGAGDYGKTLIDYLIFAGEKEKILGIIVTKRKDADRNYKGMEILEAADFFETHRNCSVIIAASLEHWDAMEETVLSKGASYRIMTQELYTDMQRKMDGREKTVYQELDFLLAGFEKCGTTSLYAALKKIPAIYLSDKKESHYFSWFHMVEGAREKLIAAYFDNIRKGQIVGMIEPTFWASAKEIHAEFGGTIRLLFLVRNPVDAVFSYFKMANCLGEGNLLEAYRRSGGRFHVSMFDEYFSGLIAQEPEIFQYDYWMESFLKEYPHEQVNVILFEDLIQNPNEQLHEILKYIGVCEEREFTELPIVNEGNFVMADSEGYELAGRKFMLFRERDLLDAEEKSKKERECLEVQKLYAKAEKIYGVKMTDRQRTQLCEHFDGSVRRLEKLLGRDLTELWF